MRRSRGDRRDLALRKRLHRYNQLRETYRSRWQSDSELWRRAKSDTGFPKWANDPDDDQRIMEELRSIGVATNRHGMWYYREGARFGVWSDKERRDLQEAKEI